MCDYISAIAPIAFSSLVRDSKLMSTSSGGGRGGGGGGGGGVFIFLAFPPYLFFSYAFSPMFWQILTPPPLSMHLTHFVVAGK